MKYLSKDKIHLIVCICLAIAIAFLFRIQFNYPHHPDHFTWGQLTQVMVDKGYAPWVMHPASLLGYYPLSIASGLQFFFVYLAVFTGLDLDTLFVIVPILFGLIGALNIFLLMRRWNSFFASFLAAFILLTMSFFAKVTAYTASTRIFNIIWYPLFILSLFKSYESWKESKVRSLKYLLFSVLLFALMSLTHRLSQLSVIFIGSWIIAIVLFHWEQILEQFQSAKWYKRRSKFYEESRLHIVLDIIVLLIVIAGFLAIKSKKIFIVFAVFCLIYFSIANYRKLKDIHLVFIDFLIYSLALAGGKILDLYSRGRLFHYLPNILQNMSLFDMAYIVAIGLLLALVVVHMLRKKLIGIISRPLSFIERYVDRFFLFFAKKPDFVLSTILFTLLLGSLFFTFTQGGVYNIDDTYFKSSFLISGESQWIVVLNFLFNLNNNLTILIWFSVFGLWYLFFSKHKTVYHYFFMLCAIFFAQLILDWQYVRLYLNPLYAVYIALGISFLVDVFSRFRKSIRITGTVALVIIFALHITFSTVFMHRDALFDELGLQPLERVPEEYYAAAGYYLSFDETAGDFSILNSKEDVRYQRVAYYAGAIGAVSAQSVYTQDKPYNITSITFDEIKEDIQKGNKIQQAYTLNDWIFGKDYYHGKHIYRLTQSDLLDKHTKEILNSYNIRYMVDSDIAQEKFKIFESLQPIKNKVYANPRIDVYDMQKGRQ